MEFENSLFTVYSVCYSLFKFNALKLLNFTIIKAAVRLSGHHINVKQSNKISGNKAVKI